MKYKRTEHRNGYDVITTVDDSGNYESLVKYNDGTIRPPVKSTLQNMGWGSLKEFLRERQGFAKVV